MAIALPANPSRKIKALIFAVLLAGCSGQSTKCEPFAAETIFFAELEGRFPIKIANEPEAQEWVDRSRNILDCLYTQRPEFAAGIEYSETRKSRNGEKIFLFTDRKSVV